MWLLIHATHCAAVFGELFPVIIPWKDASILEVTISFSIRVLLAKNAGVLPEKVLLWVVGEDGGRRWRAKVVAGKGGGAKVVR